MTHVDTPLGLWNNDRLSLFHWTSKVELKVSTLDKEFGEYLDKGY